MKNIHVLSLAAMATAFGKGLGPQFVLDYAAATGYPDPLVSNAAGTELEMLFAPKREFTTLSDYDSVTTLDDIGQISTNHAFGSGDGFSKLRVLPNTGKPGWKSTAPNGGGYMLSATFKAKGNAALMRGLAVQLQNDDMVFLIPTKDGQHLQIGGKNEKAIVALEFDGLTDEATEDVGIVFTISCAAKWPTYYKGTITLKS